MKELLLIISRLTHIRLKYTILLKWCFKGIGFLSLERDETHMFTRLTSLLFFITMDSDSELESAAPAAVAITIIVKRWNIKKYKRNRSTWVKDWLKRRAALGVSTTLLSEFRQKEHFEYEKYLWINHGWSFHHEAEHDARCSVSQYQISHNYPFYATGFFILLRIFSRYFLRNRNFKRTHLLPQDNNKKIHEGEHVHLFKKEIKRKGYGKSSSFF